MKIFRNEEQKLWAAFLASALVLLGAGVWAYAALRGIHEPLILHFSPYTGINEIGALPDLFGVVITALILVGMNGFLAFILLPREPQLARLIGTLTLVVAILLFIGFMAIIGANT